MKPHFYNPQFIEPKWQQFWEAKNLFAAEPCESTKPKYYVLDMFPYPSSSGLHVGHPEGYTATDIVARYKRARGFNVLHPMGWDAFGLPAEQYALQTGIHPEVTTRKAIDNFKRQLKMLGFSYDWAREFATCDPDYYKWTQFLFLKLYERGLAYQTEATVNWCPALKTVLANEEVVDGLSERGSHPVHRLAMRQWMLKITNYAERLLRDLEGLDWPESTKELQRNWIGRSEGLDIGFPVDGGADGIKEIRVFTTRADTLFGVTFVVVAPEHPVVKALTTPDHHASVLEYVDAALKKSEIARQEGAREKSGVFLGFHVRHPFTNARIPVWCGDYVMMNYGTGAVMSVPAHDARDFEFAKKYELPIKVVIRAINSGEGPGDFGAAFENDGICVESEFITGLDSPTARERVGEEAEKKQIGKRTVTYKLRDWLFSRQRYWGEPFPILRLSDGSVRAVPADLLPVTLPQTDSYEPSGSGESPLATMKEWVESKDPGSGQPAWRETDTMPGSAGSSWYFLRYCDPKNQSEPFSRASEKYWMPVDLYLGGAEHAVGHLLYARFWTKVLYDAGLVSVQEPFRKLVHQGMILGEDGEKMSKSRGNVINPDDVVKQYGADTLRLYEMFMGPLERDKPWSTVAIEGVHRFLQRAWRLVCDEVSGESRVLAMPSAEDDLKITHKTIKKVTEDIEHLRLNTAISQLMVFVNHMTGLPAIPLEAMLSFVQLLHPFAPHLAEEIWERLGQKDLLSRKPWPEFDPKLVQDDLITIAIQIMGKTRGTLQVKPGATQEEVDVLARSNAQVCNYLKNKPIKKVIYVPNKIINFVLG